MPVAASNTNVGGQEYTGLAGGGGEGVTRALNGSAARSQQATNLVASVSSDSSPSEPIATKKLFAAPSGCSDRHAAFQADDVR